MKTTVYPGVSRKFKKSHPVRYTKDGTRYRHLGDLLWFRIRIADKDGYCVEGDVINHDHDEPDPDHEPYIVVQIEEKDSLGHKKGIPFSESEIDSIEVLEHPKGEKNFWGPLPGPDDGYWDDDFIDEKAREIWGDGE